MATVIQRPDSLNLLRNLKSYRINTSSPVSFKLMKGADTVIEEDYNADSTGIVTIDIQDVVAQYLSVELPTSEAYSQDGAKAVFSVYVDGDFIHSFTVLSGGVRKISDSTENFLKANWLTWQPQSKKVRWYQPEYLSYYFCVAGTVKAKFYLLGGSTETVSVGSAAAGAYMTYNTQMAHLFSLSSHSADELNGLVDIWVESSDGTRLSYIQRYVFAPDDRNEHYYFCVNSLGGIDTFCFTGSLTLQPSIDHESAELSSRKLTITDSQERAWSQNTGYVGKVEAAWLWEFFAASRQWALVDENIEEIVLDGSSISASDKENLHSSTFSYTLSEEGKLLKISRSADDLPAVSVQSPSGELFFLAPRLVDFPTANLEDSLLFLVQSPYVQEWKKISLATIKAWIKEIFLPYDELPLRLEILDSGDGFLAWGESTTLTCKVWKGVYQEVTSQVTEWSISRNSGVLIEDAAWQLKEKVKNFKGTIDIVFSQSENDLGESSTATGTVFTVKAILPEESVTADITI